jgi:hypothetical protein
LSGSAVEQPSKDIDLDYMEAGHLAAFGDLFDCFREDEYLVNGRRYWTCIYFCPDPNCDCHEARVVFFDDADDSGDSVGWVYLDISGTVGIHIIEMSAERDEPEALNKELWGLFERRHDAGLLLRRREAQCKMAGETLWESVPKPGQAPNVSFVWIFKHCQEQNPSSSPFGQTNVWRKHFPLAYQG